MLLIALSIVNYLVSQEIIFRTHLILLALFLSMAQQGGNEVISSAPRITGYTNSTINQPQILVIANLGRDPAYLTCPFCNTQTVTKIEFKPNSATHALAWSGAVNNNCCMCLPYCMDDLQSAHHYCALCGKFIGKCD